MNGQGNVELRDAGNGKVDAPQDTRSVFGNWYDVGLPRSKSG